MTVDQSTKYQKLIDALKWYDENSRLERAKRIDWAGSLYQSPGLIVGEIVPLSMMEEARVCFVNGQNMATVLCATSVIEHLLVAQLESAGRSSGRLFLGDSIGIAEKAQMYSAEVIHDLREINELRNPLAHRRDANHPSTLANRYLARKAHPNLIKEQDARRSLEVMYKYFLQVLKPGAKEQG
jgi:hypothetical protein